jgi:signal transduction histidine kinase
MKVAKTWTIAVGLALAATAMAGDKGSAEEATALVKKAIAYLKDNGKEKVLAEINNPNGRFKDRDLYVFVFDMNGNSLAHSAMPKMVGKNVTDLKDADGKVLFKAYRDTVNTSGKGWVDYRWPNPVSGKIEQKSTYVEKQDDMIFASGIYKN